MKQIILSSAILEFKWFIVDASMKVNGLGPLLPKRKLSLQEIWNFPSPWLQDAKKQFSPHKENICNQNHLFCLRLVFAVFIHAVFKSHLKKIIPASSANPLQKSQFDLCPSYINLLKNGSTFHHKEGVGLGIANCK